MSRIGKSPVTIPSGVSISVDSENVVNVKGPKGEFKQPIHSDFSLQIEEGVATLSRPSESKQHKALHGLYRSLINNAVVGVHTGHSTRQELVGVGYKVSNIGQIMEFSLGHSHKIMLQVPSEVKVTTETLKGQNPSIVLESVDKQLLGQIAAKIRSFRKPEPFKGKGIKFTGEQLRRKAGKTAGK